MPTNREQNPAGLLSWMVAAAAASMLSGCAYMAQMQETPRYTAVPKMRAAQILNPDAGRSMRVVMGLDGQAAEQVNESYSKSFKAKQGEASKSFAGLSGLSN